MPEINPVASSLSSLNVIAARVKWLTCEIVTYVDDFKRNVITILDEEGSSMKQPRAVANSAGL